MTVTKKENIINQTKIGKEAFRGCSQLKKITIKSKKLKTVGKNGFKGVKANAKIIRSSASYCYICENKTHHASLEKNIHSLAEHKPDGKNTDNIIGDTFMLFLIVL